MKNQTDKPKWTAEVGKSLKLRSGGKMTVTKVVSGKFYGNGKFAGLPNQSYTWRSSGHFVHDSTSHPLDVVGEWEEPVAAPVNPPLVHRVSDRLPTRRDAGKSGEVLWILKDGSSCVENWRWGSSAAVAWMSLAQILGTKLVPLSCEDIEIGSLLRRNITGWVAIESYFADRTGVYTVAGPTSFKLAFDLGMEYLPPRADLISGWKPCWKEVTA